MFAKSSISIGFYLANVYFVNLTVLLESIFNFNSIGRFLLSVFNVLLPNRYLAKDCLTA